MPEIDGDHRTMLDLMKAVQTAAATQNRQRTEHYLDRLIAFSECHFAQENVLLKRWNYPDAELHAQYHAGLLERATAVRQACVNIGAPQTYQECCEEMMSFLIDDVVQGDMRLKSFFDDAGPSLPLD